MNLDEYRELVKSHIHDPTWLARECMERMKVNLGLIAENTELRKRVQLLEEGRVQSKS